MRTGSISKGFIVIITFIIGMLLFNYDYNGKPSKTNTVLDVSWPNCNIAAPVNNGLGVIGVTGGLDFRSNPCLYNESRWFSHIALYTNTGYAGIKNARNFLNYPNRCSYNNELCLAYNYGFNSGKYAVNYANDNAVHSTSWWLDVETDNSWSSDYLYNRADLQGTIDALEQFTFKSSIGIYSTLYQWDSITGNWQNTLPNWVATGGSSYLTAKSYCQGQAFNGGNTWLSQYTLRLDTNYLCNEHFISSLSKPTDSI